jgi:hypothetical protein
MSVLRRLGPSAATTASAGTVAASTAVSSTVYEGIAGVSYEPQLTPRAADGRDRPRNALIAVAVAMATFALLSGGVSLVVVRRRRNR